jgi:hypothetical protein
MRIGVVSDTHDHLTLIDRAVDLFNRHNVQAMIHPGDLIAPFAAARLLKYPGPIYVIYGNNDGERAGLRRILPQIKDGPLHLNMGGRRIVVAHFIDWCSSEDLAKAEIVITGHTHEVVNERQNGTLYLNPGECCGWVNDRPTVAILDTDLLSAEIMEL